LSKTIKTNKMSKTSELSKTSRVRWVRQESSLVRQVYVKGCKVGVQNGFFQSYFGFPLTVETT